VIDLVVLRALGPVDDEIESPRLPVVAADQLGLDLRVGLG